MFLIVGEGPHVYNAAKKYPCVSPFVSHRPLIPDVLTSFRLNFLQKKVKTLNNDFFSAKNHKKACIYLINTIFSCSDQLL